jgi:hypothetical protein
MAVTKETYSAAATWTAAQAADLLEDAFIDADLMASWYDSFLSGTIENRVLEVEYDATKAYGKCYYWFVVSTGSIRVSVATGWDDTNHVPTGTQYTDYFSTATDTVNNHFNLAGTLSTATQLTVTRYTSGDNSDYSWFVIRNDSTPFPFFIAPASVPIVPWLDLNETLFHHVITSAPQVSSATGSSSIARLWFQDLYRLRRSFVDSQGIRTTTTASQFATANRLFGYKTVGVGTSTAASNDLTNNLISAPYRLQATGLPFGANYTPILYGCSYSFYINEPLPVDFGVHFPFTNTAFSFGDTIVVTAGIEEWEVLDFANNSSTSAANPLLLARVV